MISKIISVLIYATAIIMIVAVGITTYKAVTRIDNYYELREEVIDSCNK